MIFADRVHPACGQHWSSSARSARSSSCRHGVGFDTYDISRDYSTRGSLGMVNMRERAERIDGSLRVESTPDSGTTVTLVVPLDKHSAASEMDEDDEVVEAAQLINAG